MRMRSFILLALISLLSFLHPFTASAQTQVPSAPSATPSVDYVLPYPGILPDHPLFFLKRVRDKILILLTRDQIKKSQIFLLLADKHLVMGQLLWEKNKFELGSSTLKQGENYLLQSVLTLDDENIKNNIQADMDKIELASKKHEEVLDKLTENTTDGTILQALNEAVGITNQARQKILSLKSKTS